MNARREPPVLPQPIEARLPPVHQRALGNGVVLYTVQTGALPIAEVRTIVRTGAAVDAPAHAGRAHLTADLLLEGTTHRDAVRISDEIEGLGAGLTSRAAWHHTVVGLHVLTPRLGQAAELLADVLLNPTFRDADFERKRDERRAAILQELDEPRILATHAFNRAVFGEHHPYGVPVTGTPAAIDAMQSGMVRAFHDTWYRPDATFVIVTGDVSPDDAARLVGDRLAAWSGAAPRPAPLPDPPARESTLIRVIDRPGATQSEIRAGVAGPPRRSPDYFPLLLGNMVLGGAFTSRLNMRLREEKAYTYGASSWFSFRVGGGPFVAATAVFAGATADAVNEIVGEIDRLATEPVTEPELERARRYIVLGLPRVIETTADLAEVVMEMALHGLGLDWYDQYAVRVMEVSAAAVLEAAARWLRTDRLVIAIAGDAAAIVPELESLGIGRVEVCR